jgi:hypothetical protein
MKALNLGSTIFNLKVIGVDGALEKLDLLNKKIEEANELIKSLASSKIEINFDSSEIGLSEQQDG